MPQPFEPFLPPQAPELPMHPAPPEPPLPSRFARHFQAPETPLDPKAEEATKMSADAKAHQVGEGVALALPFKVTEPPKAFQVKPAKTSAHIAPRGHKPPSPPK